MARPRVRSRSRNTSDFLLYSADMSAGWRVIQRVSYAYGEHRSKLGEFRRLFDGFGRLVGYHAVEARHDATVSSDPSRAALGAREMQANAGLLGRSRTAGLREMDRVGRHHPVSGRVLAEEDFVERTQELVKAYTASANYHDVKTRGISDRAVRVYPRDGQR
jgi:hypothetical protein